MVSNFRWEEPGIALGGAPSDGPSCDWLSQQGIQVVVSLHPVPAEVVRRLEELGMAWIDCQLTNFAEPIPAHFRATLSRMEEEQAAGRPVYLHCQGGGGRSTTTYAAFCVARGQDIAAVLGRFPQLSRPDQQGFLRGFAAGINVPTEE